MLATNHLAAWENIYDKYSPAMFGIILSLTDNKPVAENIFQGAFLHFKESGLYSKLNYVLCARLLRNTYEYAVNYLHEIGEVPKKKNTSQKESLIYLLCTKCKSLKDAAADHNITIEEAKIHLRKEFLEIRRNKIQHQMQVV